MKTANNKLRFNRRDGECSFVPKDCLIQVYYSDHALKKARTHQIPFPLYPHKRSGEGRGAKWGIHPTVLKQHWQKVIDRSREENTPLPSYYGPISEAEEERLNSLIKAGVFNEGFADEYVSWEYNEKKAEKHDSKISLRDRVRGFAPTYEEKLYERAAGIVEEAEYLDHVIGEGCHNYTYDDSVWTRDQFNFCKMCPIAWNTANNIVNGRVTEGTWLMKDGGNFYKLVAMVESPLTNRELKEFNDEIERASKLDGYRLSNFESRQLRTTRLKEEMCRKLEKRVKEDGTGGLRKLSNRDLDQIIYSSREEDFCLVKTVMPCTLKEAKKEVGAYQAGILTH